MWFRKNNNRKEPSTILHLVYGFMQLSKYYYDDFIESWLNGKVKDYDMDMMILSIKHARQHEFRQIAKELS